MGQAGLIQHLDDVVLLGAVEHRCCDGNAGTEIFRQFHQPAFVDLRQALVIGIDVLEVTAQRLVFAVALDLVEHVADLPAQARTGPAQMGLQDLADIHAARHAQAD